MLLSYLFILDKLSSTIFCSNSNNFNSNFLVSDDVYCLLFVISFLYYLNKPIKLPSFNTGKFLIFYNSYIILNDDNVFFPSP